MSCEVPVTCRTVLGQSLGWGGFGGGDDPLRNPASGTFDGSSTAADVTRGLDLRGRCYVMTGGTGQLGREVARALVRKGAHVVIAARSMARGSALAEELKRLEVAKGGGDDADAAPSSSAPSDSTSPHASASPVTTNDATLAAAGDATVMLCDLASQDSVRAFAQSFRRKALPLHGVLCCAGVILQPYELTAEKREVHFAVNHLGHFLLVNELMSELVATASASGIQGRVVNVTSNMHHFTYRIRRGKTGPSRGIDFTQLDDPRGYDVTNSYAQSKLANILHAWQLNERFRHRGTGSNSGTVVNRNGENDDENENTAVRPVAAFAVHPGTFGKELRQNLGGYLGGSFLFDVARGMFCKTPEQAAATVLYCACLGSGFGFTAAGLNQRGCYYADCGARKCSLPARDPRLARALWDESERLCGMEPGSALPKVNVRVGETFEGISAADYYGGGNNSSSGGGVMDTPGGEKMSADEESLPASSRPPLNDDDLGADPSSPNVKVTPSKSGRWGLGL